MGEVIGRLWTGKGATRLRLRIMHPMDTGLVPGIPAFYIDHLDFLDASGERLPRLFLYEPVAENPVLTLDLPRHDSVTVVGADNNGNPIEAKITDELREAEI